ncbi:methyl-accepting chemotaxis protein [Duganella qianjiadongensis]|uniref:HAMP domain-containing protein n=1 Tax=Duganella qianjiadongensis TaxID=2692176 RepID=A0ABW9VE13_9BURK|nr:methyl-accepting chemotaxis protein [Duganella qianjiadongensis]MYM37858.1 HAMP domain-containing protein [Duganella qianjiadongensis]
MQLNHYKVGTRLAAGYGLIVAFLIGITLLAYSRLANLDDSIRLIVEDRYPKVVYANQILEGISDNAIRLRNLLLLDNPELQQRDLAAIKASSERVSGYISQLDRLLTTPKGRAILADMQEARGHYLQSQQRALSLFESGDRDGAVAIIMGPMAQQRQVYFERVQGLVQLGGKLMEIAGADAHAASADAIRLMLLLAGAAILAAVACAWAVTRSITAPLNAAVSAADHVADGNLSQRIEAGRGRDETTHLINAMARMNSNLADIVQQVRHGTVSISAAAAQIAADTVDLSARTEHQASALQQTATSMEELTATVQQNAAHTAQASSLVADSRALADRGGSVVQQVVQTMDSINQSSRRIADITGVIDGIAFQTNLLALNAAVEAARAGEQGRGFAVVAGEVRNLAQRSAAAASEIKQLIATSVAQVEDGSQLVSEAGSAMQAIVHSVQQVSNVIRDIAIASEEQRCGIEQINQAIVEMDGVTQQNAHLVDQTTNASAQLDQLAGALSEVVARFRLEGAARSSMRPAATAAPLQLASASA